MNDLAIADPASSADGSAQNFATVKQFVTFLVDDRSYGLDINVVREIKQWSPTTQLPNQEVYIRGVLNLRGTIVPVHDLRARFSGVLTEATENHVVVIVWIGTKTVGILVDAVSDIISVTTDEIKPVPTEKSSGEPSIISGLVKSDEDMTALLDINVLIPVDEQSSEN